MGTTITVEELLARREEIPVLDVRAPGEFQAGHIPGALNLPLFTDEERARVGTAYKQQSPNAAMELGLAIAGTHMAGYIEETKMLAGPDQRDVIVHCWRGGKRSEAMAWLLEFTGFRVRRLSGGYKAFRQAATTCFEDPRFRFNIVGGCTGAGKTEVIIALGEMGEQVIDLEGLARHKGSAFGHIGEASQPTNEQFENELFLLLREMDPARHIWLENESKNIGRIYLPEAFWRRMRESKLFSLDVDSEVRLDRVIGYYTGNSDVEALKASFDKIHKRLGGLEYQQAVNALDAGNVRDAARIALAYYDKSYRYQLGQWPADRVIRLERCEDVRVTAERLMSTAISDL